MTLTASERDELEHLRRSAAKFMTCPLERAFFKLDSILDNPHSNRIDSILPTSVAFDIIRALKELKQVVGK